MHSGPPSPRQMAELYAPVAAQFTRAAHPRKGNAPRKVTRCAAPPIAAPAPVAAPIAAPVAAPIAAPVALSASPLGLGRAAETEEVGTVETGRDNRMWMVTKRHGSKVSQPGAATKAWARLPNLTIPDVSPEPESPFVSLSPALTAGHPLPAQRAGVRKPRTPAPQAVAAILASIKAYAEANPEDDAAMAMVGKAISGIRSARKVAARPNHGKAWSDADRGRVMALYRDGASYDAIGTEVGRSKRACQFEVDAKLVQEMVADNITAEALAERYNRSVADIQKAITAAQHNLDSGVRKQPQPSATPPPASP